MTVDSGRNTNPGVMRTGAVNVTVMKRESLEFVVHQESTGFWQLKVIVS
jgi:hypothetical protein